jgi:CDP-4-dehydro-6-deoxyglucose reductase/ferredoxin-NAD(P)+ reductase (naphthalene dioxygenase ferredoxin-specific)
MSYKVAIHGLDAEIDVAPGETILDAALRSGLPFPFGCQSGNCGACKCALVSGGVELAPYSEFALEEGERLQGMILGCRAIPLDDSTVALLETGELEAHPARELVCRVAALDNLDTIAGELAAAVARDDQDELAGLVETLKLARGEAALAIRLASGAREH